MARSLGRAVADAALLAETVVLLAASRVEFRLRRGQALRRLRAASADPAGARLPPAPPAVRAHVAWAVNAAARRWARADTCLFRALAAYRLLARRGYSATLRLGVARTDDGGFAAHAWLESGGASIVGGDARSGGLTSLGRTAP